MIYLDNAATTFPKPEAVYNSMMDCMKNYCANPGRAGHKLAMKAAREIYDTRENIARLFNIDNPMNIVFTNNATDSLNLAIKGVVKQGDHIITTSMEHNSVIIPIKSLTNKLNIPSDADIQNKNKSILSSYVLHAKTLGFTHPRTGERMHFDSDWAEDMLNLINKWRNYEPNTWGGR